MDLIRAVLKMRRPRGCKPDFERFTRAIIGGVDMHLVASGNEEQVRARTRQILDACGPGGGYVLGTGNSVANYIPLRNYLAIVDEGQRWNRERFGPQA